MKKLVSLFVIAAFVISSGLAMAQAPEVKKEAQKTEQTGKKVKKSKKSCATCPNKEKCPSQKKAEEKTEVK